MTAVRKRNFIGKAWIKLMRLLAGNFPANAVRVWALRRCGFSIGRKVYIGPGLMLSTMNSDNSCSLILEDRVSIGPRVTLVLASDANDSRLTDYFPPVRGNIHVQKDAWLGAGVIVLPNVTIGECAIVAAGAVVRESVENLTMVGGVPAKFIRKID